MVLLDQIFLTTVQVIGFHVGSQSEDAEKKSFEEEICYIHCLYQGFMLFAHEEKCIISLLRLETGL